MKRYAATLLLLGMFCDRSADATTSVRTDRVIVFKDGYALVIKTVTGTTDAKGELHLDEVPDSAVLGTFWATPQKGEILSVRSGWQEIEHKTESKVPLSNTGKLLAANRGKTVKLTMSSGTEHSGRIRAIVGDRIVLTTELGDMLLPFRQIYSASINNLKLEETQVQTTRTKKPMLTLRFKRKNARRSATVTYFRAGFQWIPTYRIDIQDPKLAQVRLQAELINDGEDLDEVPIDLVVGVPNFRFKGHPSPLVLGARRQQALSSVKPFLGNLVSNSISNNVSAELQPQAPTSKLPSSLQSNSQHSLHVHHLEPISLKRGERAALTVFTTHAPYKHLYTWKVSAAHLRHPKDRSASNNNQIMHQLELQNPSAHAWTTGAAMVVDGAQPIAQERLTYTSRGSTTRLPLTTAIEVRGVATRRQLSKKEDARLYNSYRYTRIVEQARFDVRSSLGRAIELEITATLPGESAKASLEPSGQAEVTTNGVQSQSTIVWRKKIAAGARFSSAAKFTWFQRQ